MASTQHPRVQPLPFVRTGSDDVLPQDLIYDILLRLPAKSLCRFRAVCISWSFLLCHQDFIAAHQHIAVGLFGFGPFHVALMDMDSGRIIRRVGVESTSHHGYLPQLPQEISAVSPNRALCVVGTDRRVSLMDFATGAHSLLPDHAIPRGYITISYTLGRAASTGEYKVLAVATFEIQPLLDQQQEQVCKILTIGRRNCDSNQYWREMRSPCYNVVLPTYNREATVIEGVAYFLVSGSCYVYNPELYTHHDWIMTFNLDSETWGPAPIRGPTDCSGIGLAELDGHLVAFHDDRRTCVKLWYLADNDHTIWSMLHQIVMSYHTLTSPSSLSPACYHEYFEKPLAVLGDGRIVLCMRVPAVPRSCSIQYTFLRFYDPRTGAFTDGTPLANCHNVGLHTCSTLLYTGRGGATK